MAPAAPNSSVNSSNKRKTPFTNNGNNNNRPKRAKMWDARTLSSQTSDKAFSNGELNVDTFVKAREFEIKALEDGIKRSKHGLTTRAFQEVPKELRRRTASHNVRQVPKRLRQRAAREMAEDNTPTVSARRRKPSGHQRLRLETAQRLQNLSSTNKKKRQDKKSEKLDTLTEVTVAPEEPIEASKPEQIEPSIFEVDVVVVRKPKVKASKLRTPAVPPAKFRKRQIHKTWLPTHLFHAKRATMTPPKEPLWRFALPLTPTSKNYRSTHLASTQRGAIAWDASYMATIGLEGPEKSIEGLLKAIGVGAGDREGIWARAGAKWRQGARVWEGWVYERESWPWKGITPATIIWDAQMLSNSEPQASEQNDSGTSKKKAPKRRVFIRIHPARFMQLWEQVIRLAKVQKPSVTVEDLRFELGSIELAGPNATEALVAILRPIEMEEQESDNEASRSLQELWSTISAHGPSSLPNNAIIAFEASDPRLRYPPHKLPPDQNDVARSIQILAKWPLDSSPKPAMIFERNNRLKASRTLSSQKSINRRKALAPPGEFPEPRPTDPRIPVLMCCSRSSTSSQGYWTVLLPWKCVDPVWRSILYYPLSTGGNVRFGGIQEKRQLAFESGIPWYPADYPGLEAGDEWEAQEQVKRKAEWLRKPKGRRIEFNSLNLGQDRRGEIGMGWACDWQRLVCRPEHPDATGAPADILSGAPVIDSAISEAQVDTEVPDAPDSDPSVEFHPAEDTATEGPPADVTAQAKTAEKPATDPPVKEPSAPMPLQHLPLSAASKYFKTNTSPDLSSKSLITVKITMITRGVPQTCARIYRLPTNNSILRQKWLSQIPSPKSNISKAKHAPSFPHRAPANATPAVQRAYLAASILTKPTQPGNTGFPDVPDEEDLVGFVTTGNFNLGEGKGIGIGSLLLSKVTPGTKGLVGKEDYLCVVRDAGQTVGRLAKWELV